MATNLLSRLILLVNGNCEQKPKRRRVGERSWNQIFLFKLSLGFKLDSHLNSTGE